tara:strand:- start:1783 stop:2358 length:576 start_codon:yes stop_codon:yes gene_type:complete
MLNYFSMILKFFNIKLILLILISFSFSACGGKWGSDARKISPDPKERVKKNLEEGRGFRINNLTKGQGGTTYEFASSNELWRASLDTIDFMPLTTANYNGGIIVTDWYSEDQKVGEAVKITIRFLSNEVRSDALDVKIFYKKCKTILDCEISESQGELKNELTKSILKKAAIYKKQKNDENFVPYNDPKKN